MDIAPLAAHMEHVEILAQWHLREWGEPGPTSDHAFWRNCLVQSANRDHIPISYVAIDQDAVLGSISLIAHNMDTHLELSPWLAALYVIPSHRRRGIGSALVRHLVQQAHRLEMPRLYLYTSTARDLYAKLGWRHLVEEEYEGHAVTIMALDLAI
jgi:predicted N-acetyltransferase YhbS